MKIYDCEEESAEGDGKHFICEQGFFFFKSHWKMENTFSTQDVDKTQTLLKNIIPIIHSSKEKDTPSKNGHILFD